MHVNSLSCVHTHSGVQQSCQRHCSPVDCYLVVLVMAEVLEVWLRERTGGGGRENNFLIEYYTGRGVRVQP